MADNPYIVELLENIGKPYRSPIFTVTERSMHDLYDEYYKRLEEDPENPWSPHEKIVDVILRHFRQRPLDKLSMGLLKIIPVEGFQAVPLRLNDEQQIAQEKVESLFYGGDPVRYISLKARQIGFSTYCEGVLYSVCSSFGYLHAHIVADLIEKCEHQRNIFNTYWAEEPVFVRPIKTHEKPLTFNDPAKRIRNTKLRFESAERRGNIGRSFTGQLNHYTEVAFWPDAFKAQIINSLKKTVHDVWPTMIFEESSGNDVGDLFYNRYFKAKHGELGAYTSVFFPVQDHKSYRKPLEPGDTVEMFRQRMRDADRERMDTYNVSAEFMRWYIDQREEEVLDEATTELLFCREFPMCEDEAFLGANSNWFDVQRCKRDIARTRADRRLLVLLDELPESTSFIVPVHDDQKIRVARVHLHTDWESNYRDVWMQDYAELKDSPQYECDWLIWERPRPGHAYVVGSDPATGKQTQKNVKASADNTALGVWRYTYDERERPMIVQVAQCVRKGIQPKETARYAMAISTLYVPYPGINRRALVVPEANAHGQAMIDELADAPGANIYRQREIGVFGEVISENLGFQVTGGRKEGSKLVLYGNLRQAYHHDMLLINSNQTAVEFSTFVEKEGSLKAIEPNKDDTVTEAALGLEGVRFNEAGVIAPKQIARHRIAAIEPKDLSGREAPKLTKEIWRKRCGRTAAIGAEDVVRNGWGI
jgi:hypothetical protein